MLTATRVGLLRRCQIGKQQTEQHIRDEQIWKLSSEISSRPSQVIVVIPSTADMSCQYPWNSAFLGEYNYEESGLMAEMTKAAKWHTNAIREQFPTSPPTTTPTTFHFFVSFLAPAKTFSNNFWSKQNSFEGISERAIDIRKRPMTEVADCWWYRARNTKN